MGTIFFAQVKTNVISCRIFRKSSLLITIKINSWRMQFSLRGITGFNRYFLLVKHINCDGTDVHITSKGIILKYVM